MSTSATQTSVPTITFKLVCCANNYVYPAIFSYLASNGSVVDSILQSKAEEFESVVRGRAIATELTSRHKLKVKAWRPRLRCHFSDDTEQQNSKLFSILRHEASTFDWAGSEVSICIDQSVDDKCFCQSKLSHHPVDHPENWLSSNVVLVHTATSEIPIRSPSPGADLTTAGTTASNEDAKSSYVEAAFETEDDPFGDKHAIE